MVTANLAMTRLAVFWYNKGINKNKVMDRKQFIGNLITGLQSFGKKLGNLLIVVIALVAGCFIGYYYSLMMTKTDKSHINAVKPISTTSVAINERSELLIIDRKTGLYTIYEDSVGAVIFNLYANKMYKQNSK
jgi:hypothetical protein